MLDMGSITLTDLVAAVGIVGCLVGAFKTVYAPIKKFSSRIDKVESNQANDLKRLDLFDRDLKEIMKVQRVMLEHMQTGNATGKMAQVRTELEDYIIERK